MGLTIRLFRKDALRDAYEAGRQAATADPSNWKEIFEAGEKKGSGYLNEASLAPGFIEFMSPRREESPGSFSSWYGMNEKRLSTTLDREQYELAATEKKMEITAGKKLINLNAIEEAVRAVFNISLDDLRYSKRRLDAIAVPRFYCHYLSYHHCHITLMAVGKHLGGRGHATVLHGAKVVYREATQYPEKKKLLVLLYRYLAREGYNTDYFLDADSMPSRCGANRNIVKRVNLYN